MGRLPISPNAALISVIPILFNVHHVFFFYLFQSNNDKQLKEDALDDSITYEFIQEMAKTMGQGDKNHDMNVIMTLLQVSISFIFFFIWIQYKLKQEGIP